MNKHGSAVRRNYQISDWTFFLGLPTTPAEFVHAKAYGEFCLLPPPLRTFEDYRTALLGAFEQHIAPLTQLGLRIVPYGTARDFCRLLQGTNAAILFTHCDGHRLEFRDGMIPFGRIVDTIEIEFAGIAEICACAPIGLQELVKTRAPASLVKVSQTSLSPGLWMAYYGYFLSGFASETTTFGDACLRANTLLNQLRQRAVSAQRAVPPPEV